jgi:hypothetical protein
MDYFEYLRAIRSSNLSTKARIVALIIASYNPSFPTNKQIAEGTGLCERTVRSAKVELVAAGYLIQKRNYDAANAYTPTAPDAAGYGKTLPSKYKVNTNINTNNKSSNEDLYISSNKKMPEEIIEIKEMAASPWDGWR